MLNVLLGLFQYVVTVLLEYFDLCTNPYINFVYNYFVDCIMYKPMNDNRF